MTIMKQCNHPSCKQLIPFDKQYCMQHTHLKREKHKVYDYSRNREDKPYRDVYHSARWRKLRKQALIRDEYLCQECLKKGYYTPADVVDHIREIKDDISKAFDIDNLNSLCHKHHNIKTRKESESRKQSKPKT